MFGLLLIHLFRSVFQMPDWWRKVLPGGTLNLMPTLVLGLLLAGQLAPTLGIVLLVISFGFFLIAWGYLYRIFIDALNGTEVFVLPDWADLRGYALAGFWIFLIALGYGMMAALGVYALLSVFGGMPRADAPESLGILSFLLLGVLIFFYGFLPVVLTRFAAERRVWAAFEPGPVWRDLKRVVGGAYIQVCFGLFGISLLGNLVLGLVPGVGVILAANFWFLLMAVFSRIFGLMIRERLMPQEPPDIHEG